MNERRAVVIGAGIVGVACALTLQRDGWRVTLLDPEAPGEGASKGNAGIIAVDHTTPLALPGLLPRVPRMLLDSQSPLAIRWRYLPRLLPWLARFLAASTPGRVERISRALATLMAGAADAYTPLVEGAGARELFRRQGVVYVYAGAASFARARAEMAIRRRTGVEIEELGAAELGQLVPGLSADITHGAFFPASAHVVDPHRLVQMLAEDLVGRGGTLVKERAVGFEFRDRAVAGVRTGSGRHGADAVVVAAGAWSNPLARRLGVRVPLDTERGYNVTLPAPGIELRLPVVSGDFAFALTPMAMGVRLAGTVEFAGLEAPPDPARSDALIAGARRLFPEIDTSDGTTWMGCRPSMPDSLPVIGRAPSHPNAFLAFGHGHIGLTTAAITGRAVADLAAGRPPPLDLSPFRPDRFL
ncbi:MAG: FAD-dependent oxidoreductase [Alphaproteobacteria bacterium]